jgi:hypothetical protein
MNLAILGFADGVKPFTGAQNGKVAVWADDEGEPTGFVLSYDAAVETALGLLAKAAAMANHPTVLQVSAASTLVANVITEDCAARLIFDTDGGPLAIDMSAAMLAEIAAALGALSRSVG